MSRTTGLFVGFGLTLLLAAGCRDAAEPDYERCKQLEAEGKLEDALVACDAAQKADKNSPSGQKATRLKIKLYDRIEAEKKDREDAAAKHKEQSGIQDAESKVRWELVSTPPKDPHGYSERCMARNRAYENSYNCVPQDPSKVSPDDAFPFKQECMLLAERRGCMPFHAETPTKLFCCAK
ncbi:MAG: hypothetical protein MUF54_14325 [Polyangiaceae bacterium]|nr:hypothetical protein [Polyangiaceae bacterium]